MAAPGGAPHPQLTWSTGRAALLAVVLCAVALSLAYPVREYIGQKREIDSLRAQRQVVLTQLRRLQAEQRRLKSPGYTERLARQKLGLCMRGDTCYVVLPVPHHHTATVASATVTPWYEKLWASVRTADQVPAR